MNNFLALTIILIALTSVSSKAPPRRRENTIKKKEEQPPSLPPPPPVQTTAAVKPLEIQQQIDTGECATNSLLKETYWVFKGDRIKCGAPNYSSSTLCKSSLFRPTTVSCRRSEDPVEEFNVVNYLVQDSENDNYKQLIGTWACESPSSWIDDITIVCPMPYSVCNPMSACYAVFNPFDTLFDVACICLLVILTAACLCGIPCVLYITHCFFMIEARQPSPIETGAVPYVQKKKRATHES
jgi:hypothetical protein